MGQTTGEVLEIVAVTGSYGVSAGLSGNDIMWTARVDIIAWKNLHDRSITEEKKKILWRINRSDISKYRELIAPNCIVRLSVTNAGDHFSLNQVIAQQYTDSDLAVILYKALEPVYYDDSLLGRFTLDKTIDTFCKPVVWAGEKGKFYFDNCPDERSIKLSLQVAHQLFDKQDSWCAKTKAFAAEELVELANDWLSDNEDSTIKEITPEIFIDRIGLESINVKPNGNFEIYFTDGDLFWGHVIIVEGNINGTFTRAEIAG